MYTAGDLLMHARKITKIIMLYTSILIGADVEFCVKLTANRHKLFRKRAIFWICRSKRKSLAAQSYEYENNKSVPRVVLFCHAPCENMQLLNACSLRRDPHTDMRHSASEYRTGAGCMYLEFESYSCTVAASISLPKVTNILRSIHWNGQM